MKIICIGDSLTYGYCIARDETWINLSKDKLNFDIINEGINGDTTGGMLSRFNESVIFRTPDIVFIMGGSNDLISGAYPGIIQSNIMAMTNQAIKGAITPIIGIPPKIDLEHIREDWSSFTDFDKVAAELDNYKNWIRNFGKTFNISIIDFNTEIDKYSQQNSEYLYIDGLHLNERGQLLMANIFSESIVELFKQ